jgi:hypothetical protein|tara:strand:- start:1320 stop:1742 length:423 start_codon:yes stop_codon:yes gene_type:complete
MTVLYSAEMNDLLGTVPASLPSGGVVDGNVRVKRATITLASQATSDTIVIAKAAEGETFLYGVTQASATLGSSATVAIGITGATGKYRAAATHTTTAPVVFGLQAASVTLAAGEEIFITIASAALPSSGTFVVDLYFSNT